MNAGMQKIKEVTPKHVVIVFLILVLLGLIWNAASSNTQRKKKCNRQTAFERVVETTEAIGETTVEGVKETGKAVKEVIQLEEQTNTSIAEQGNDKVATGVVDTDKPAEATIPTEESDDVVKKITTEVDVIINIKTPDGKPVGEQPIVLEVGAEPTKTANITATTKPADATTEATTEAVTPAPSTPAVAAPTTDPINQRIDEKIEHLLKEVEQLKALKESLQTIGK